MEVALEDSDSEDLESEDETEILLQIQKPADPQITQSSDAGTQSDRQPPKTQEIILRPSGDAKRVETLSLDEYQIDDDEANLFETIWQWAVDKVVP